MRLVDSRLAIRRCGLPYEKTLVCTPKSIAAFFSLPCEGEGWGEVGFPMIWNEYCCAVITSWPAVRSLSTPTLSTRPVACTSPDEHPGHPNGRSRRRRPQPPTQVTLSPLPKSRCALYPSHTEPVEVRLGLRLSGMSTPRALRDSRVRGNDRESGQGNSAPRPSDRMSGCKSATGGCGHSLDLRGMSGCKQPDLRRGHRLRHVRSAGLLTYEERRRCAAYSQSGSGEKLTNK